MLKSCVKFSSVWSLFGKKRNRFYLGSTLYRRQLPVGLSKQVSSQVVGKSQEVKLNFTFVPTTKIIKYGYEDKTRHFEKMH